MLFDSAAAPSIVNFCPYVSEEADCNAEDGRVRMIIGGVLSIVKIVDWVVTRPTASVIDISAWYVPSLIEFVLAGISIVQVPVPRFF